MTDIQEFQRLDKYARFQPELGRRETWPETVTRVMTFFREYKKFNLPDPMWDDLRQGLIDKEAFPSMRVIQMAGPSLERCEVGAFNCAAVALDSINSFAELLYVLMQGTGCSFSVERQFIGQLPEVSITVPMDEPVGPFTIDDTTEGWCDALKAGMVSWFNGIEVEFDTSLIRPSGARLVTKGGFASGPGPLIELLDFTRTIIRGAVGRQLTSVECHRIACKIADIVQVGGVRRAATLSHSDLDDLDMQSLKNGAFWETMPELSQANNSAVYLGPLDHDVFDVEWENLRTSGTGERGIIRRDSILPARRKPLKAKMNNPCVTQDTWVMTDSGARQVRDLVGSPFRALVDGKYQTSQTGFFPTGVKDVYQVKTSRGYTFKATANHKVMTVDGWVEVQDLNGNDLTLQRPSSETWGDPAEFDMGWLLGNLYGDGVMMPGASTARLTYWGDEKVDMRTIATDRLKSCFTPKSNVGSGAEDNEYDRISVTSRELYHKAVDLGMYTRPVKRIPDGFEGKSSSFIEGFLSGWFDADGSVQGTKAKGYSVRLSSVDYPALESAQRALLQLGIKSTLYADRKVAGFTRLPDGRGGLKLYPTQAQHELVLTGQDMVEFQRRVGFSYPSSCAYLSETINSYKTGPYVKADTTRVVSVTHVGLEPVFDCVVNEVHRFNGNGLTLHNCGEVDFDPSSFCNLSLAKILATDTKVDILRKVRLATIWGTLQSDLTQYRYLSPKWKKNVEAERLLGVDIPGAESNKLFNKPGYISKLRDEVVKINREIAGLLGINPSVATTVVKPGGNSGVFLGVGHPVNGYMARYMIRRVRSGTQTPMFAFLRDQGVEYELETERTAVFDFLVAAPESALISTEMTALQQLDRWLMLKQNWTEHNPSVTIYVGDDEWGPVGQWVKDNWEWVGGLSFFPKTDHVYRLAPIEAISKTEYESRVAAFPQINWDLYYEYETADATTLGGDFACVGGVCSL